MAPHEERMLEERDQLTERLGKLARFIAYGGKFSGMLQVERDLLMLQYHQMCEYRATLDKRIDLIEPSIQ